jgi:hypothetical protein
MWSLVLVDDGATRGKCRGINGHAVDRRMIGVVEVRILPPKHHLLSSGMEIGEAEATPATNNFMCIPRGHRQERPGVGLLEPGLRFPRTRRGWLHRHVL